ncbi:cation transporter [Flavobacterium sp.]|jgi:copper chaperone|uniref:cation transporter n=1 Tax=Flavobacterium sp. TaxID=239 RepID=UPI0037BFAC12
MKTTLRIQNLKCGGCANTIVSQLNALNKVSDVSVVVDKAEVTLQHEDELALLNAKETLKLIGYPEEGEVNSFGTKAKSYVSCAIGKMS